MTDWPETRPVDYDADKAYDESAKTWTANSDDLNKSGGRYKEVLVAVGNKVIFFSEI